MHDIILEAKQLFRESKYQTKDMFAHTKPTDAVWMRVKRGESVLAMVLEIPSQLLNYAELCALKRMAAGIVYKGDSIVSFIQAIQGAKKQLQATNPQPPAV
jgi:hypothetical protein